MKSSTHNILKAIEEALADAEAAGHKLTPFAKVRGGFRSTCKYCGKTRWVGRKGVRHPLLSDECEGQPGPAGSFAQDVTV